MTNDNDARRAHDVLDGLFSGRILSRENEQLLRSFLPELPKQMTLQEIHESVLQVWVETGESEWLESNYGPLKDWLNELSIQLLGILDENDSPKPPEFLETEDGYESAPEGTVVARDSINPWVKEEGAWVQGSAADATVYTVPYLKGPRRVLRWGNK